MVHNLLTKPWWVAGGELPEFPGVPWIHAFPTNLRLLAARLQRSFHGVEKQQLSW